MIELTTLWRIIIRGGKLMINWQLFGQFFFSNIKHTKKENESEDVIPILSSIRVISVIIVLVFSIYFSPLK